MRTQDAHAPDAGVHSMLQDVYSSNGAHSNHSPFLRAAPIQDAHAPDAGFLSGHVHLCR
jgi:hypothetical protein